MKRLLMLLAVTMLAGGCKVTYKFSGASISPKVETATVVYFPNMATLVAPTLAVELNDKLTQKIQRETRLRLLREGGDVVFEGEIVDYRSEPVSFSGGGGNDPNQSMATQNRLTITVRAKFTDNKEPNNSYQAKTFSAYADYDSSQMLSSVEGALIPEIVEKIVQDIFNEAFANW